MFATCLSVLGPCKEVCDRCQASYDNYVAQEIAKQIRDAIRVLQHHGYKITSPDNTPID